MLTVLFICVFVLTFFILVSIAMGWVLLPIIWIGFAFLLVAIGWLATIYIKPRYPEWWDRNIAHVVTNRYI
ncbi:MAG: hypothetical protein R3264_07020 [Anaerolineae bacterium]|nr:hypothetical protein [Anaerolineae bacterium]